MGCLCQRAWLWPLAPRRRYGADTLAFPLWLSVLAQVYRRKGRMAIPKKRIASSADWSCLLRTPGRWRFGSRHDASGATNREKRDGPALDRGSPVSGETGGPHQGEMAARNRRIIATRASQKDAARASSRTADKNGFRATGNGLLCPQVQFTLDAQGGYLL